MKREFKNTPIVEYKRRSLETQHDSPKTKADIAPIWDGKDVVLPMKDKLHRFTIRLYDPGPEGDRSLILDSWRRQLKTQHPFSLFSTSDIFIYLHNIIEPLLECSLVAVACAPRLMAEEEGENRWHAVGYLCCQGGTIGMGYVKSGQRGNHIFRGLLETMYGKPVPTGIGFNYRTKQTAFLARKFGFDYRYPRDKMPLAPVHPNPLAQQVNEE